MSEIENNSCVRNIMRGTQVSGIEIEPWGAASIIRKVNDVVYICTCNVKPDGYNCCKKVLLFLTVTSNLCIYQTIVVLSLII